jgi:hypothetical protein
MSLSIQPNADETESSSVCHTKRAVAGGRPSPPRNPRN